MMRCALYFYYTLSLTVFKRIILFFHKLRNLSYRIFAFIRDLMLLSARQRARDPCVILFCDLNLKKCLLVLQAASRFSSHLFLLRSRSYRGLPLCFFSYLLSARSTKWRCFDMCGSSAKFFSSVFLFNWTLARVADSLSFFFSSLSVAFSFVPRTACAAFHLALLRFTANKKGLSPFFAY